MDLEASVARTDTADSSHGADVLVFPAPRQLPREQTHEAICQLTGEKLRAVVTVSPLKIPEEADGFLTITSGGATVGPLAKRFAVLAEQVMRIVDLEIGLNIPEKAPTAQRAVRGIMRDAFTRASSSTDNFAGSPPRGPQV